MTSTHLAAPLCLLLAAGAAPAAAAAPAPASASPAAPTERLLDPAAAWRGARWGMSVDEVLKAFPGTARRLQPEQKLADGKVVAVELQGIDAGGLTYRAHFLFEGGGLALVSLKSLPSRPAEVRDYEALKARLAQESGQPGQERQQDLTVDYREIRFTAGGTAVDVKFLQGTLVLLYHPAGG